MDTVEGPVPPEAAATAAVKPDQDTPKPPELGEKVKIPEVPDQTRTREIDRVANNAFYRKTDFIASELNGLSEEQRNQVLGQDKGKKAIYDIYSLQHAASGDQKIEFNGNPVVVSRKDADGNKLDYTIVSIENADEENFTCTAFKGRDPESRDSDMKFTRAEIINAQIVSEKEVILSQFEGATRDVVEMEIKMLAGENPLEGSDPSAINGVIREAAQASGMLTADDVGALAEKQSETTGERDKLMQAVEGKNIVDVETAIEIFSALGYNPETAESQRSTVTKNRLDVQEQLKRNDLTPQARQQNQEQLEQLRTKETIFRKVAEVSKENGPLQQFFKMMEEGKIDIAKAKSIIANFKSGNFESLVETAFTELDLELDKNLSPEEKAAQRQEMMALLKKRSKVAGIGLLFLLFSLATSAIEAGKR